MTRFDLGQLWRKLVRYCRATDVNLSKGTIDRYPTLTPHFRICLPISHLQAARQSLALQMRGSGDVLLSYVGGG
jgi:hypothetical protein